MKNDKDINFCMIGIECKYCTDTHTKREHPQNSEVGADKKKINIKNKMSLY